MTFYVYFYNDEEYHDGKVIVEGKTKLAEMLTDKDNMQKHIVVTDTGDELIMELDHFQPVGFGYGATEEEIMDIIDEMKRVYDIRNNAA